MSVEEEASAISKRIAEVRREAKRSNLSVSFEGVDLLDLLCEAEDKLDNLMDELDDVKSDRDDLRGQLEALEKASA